MSAEGLGDGGGRWLLCRFHNFDTQAGAGQLAGTGEVDDAGAKDPRILLAAMRQSRYAAAEPSRLQSADFIQTSMPTTAAVLRDLAQRRLLVVTGKGGVGKSAFAAALALHCGYLGRKVLLLEVDPRENAHQMLGLPPSSGEIAAAGDRVWLQNLKPRQVLDQIVRERVHLGVIARRVLASPIYQQICEGMPGLRQLALIDHARRLTDGGSREGEFDLVVLDAPATGHGLSLLDAPRLVSEVITEGPIGALAAELAELVGDADSCGLVVVTLAEEMPVQETLELAVAVEERLGRAPDLLVVNSLYPPLDPKVNRAGAGAIAGGDDDCADGCAARSLWHRRRAINDRELARLDGAWSGPRIELPLLPLGRGPELARRLATLLTAGTGGEQP